MELFAQATRKAFRYPSIVGWLTTEQLWTIPLTAEGKPNLNDVAKEINADLRKANEDNFVSTNVSPEEDLLTLKLEVVKTVIAVKQDEIAKAKEAIERRAKRNKILDALEKRENADMEAMSREDLLKELEALDA